MLVLHYLLVAQSSSYAEDWSEGPTWCTYATCNPNTPTYLPWAHGRSGVERTCVQNEAPFNFTLVDTFDLTVWSASVGADVSSDVTTVRQAGVAEQMEALILTQTDTVVRRVQLAVTPDRNRQLIELPAPQTEPLWIRLQAAPDNSHVASHYIFYEMVLYQRANPPPAGALACVLRTNSLCGTLGYTHSSACAPAPPLPPAPPPPQPSQPVCGDDCECECCLPGQCEQRTLYSYRAGTADMCSDLQCQTRFYSCPDAGAHNAEGYLRSTYRETAPCTDLPPSTPPPGELGDNLVQAYTIAVILASVFAACVFVLSCFLLWVRRREKEGEPVWTSLDKVVAPEPGSTPRGGSNRTMPRPALGPSSDRVQATPELSLANCSRSPMAAPPSASSSGSADRERNQAWQAGPRVV